MTKFRDAIYNSLYRGAYEKNIKENSQEDLQNDFINNRERTKRSGINTDNISFSLDEDSQGRELTQQQVEFFSDSKVRNDNGNLQAYYNGSDYFYEYDKTKLSDESKWGKGIYLTNYNDVENANIDNEYISDFVGKLLFINEEFIRKLSTNNSLFNKIYTEIKYIVKSLKAGSDEQKALLNVQHAFEKANIIGWLKSNNKETKNKQMYKELFNRFPKYFKTLMI